MDILIFRTNKLISGTIRIYSDSHFDHVGMLLKSNDEPDDVFFVDATSNGV